MRAALAILALAFCALLEVSGRFVEAKPSWHPVQHHQGHRACSGDDSCCTRSDQCGQDEGDCDDDHDCSGSLVCGENNCYGPGFDGTDDCCESPWGRCDGGDSCCTHGRPCGVGEGDCDTNSDCAGWLVCGKDNCGRRRGFDDTDDCCRERCYGGDSCCTHDYQCDIGEGDCDHDSDCAGNLKCGSNNCRGQGFDKTDDCCYDPDVDHRRNKYKAGGDDICTEMARAGVYCMEGQGDCDHDRECYGELVCGTDNCQAIHGQHSAFDSTDDCCEAPWNIYTTRQKTEKWTVRDCAVYQTQNYGGQNQHYGVPENQHYGGQNQHYGGQNQHYGGQNQNYGVQENPNYGGKNQYHGGQGNQHYRDGYGP